MPEEPSSPCGQNTLLPTAHVHQLLVLVWKSCCAMFYAHAVPWVFVIMMLSLTGASVSSLNYTQIPQNLQLVFLFLERILFRVYWMIFPSLNKELLIINITIYYINYILISYWLLLLLNYRFLYKRWFCFHFAPLFPLCIYTQPHSFSFYTHSVTLSLKLSLLTSFVLLYIPFCTCMFRLQTVCCFNPFTRLRETNITCKNPGGLLWSVVQQRLPSKQESWLQWLCLCSCSISLGVSLATPSSGEDDQ